MAAVTTPPERPDTLDAGRGEAADVARWRRVERERLRSERMALDVETRRRTGQAVAAQVRELLAGRFRDLAGLTISGYWPIKGELDLRSLMAEWHAAGATVALPLVEIVAAPLVFRRWTPATRLVRGHWNIPVPPPQADRVEPQIVLAPLVGWDGQGYRLGYGGGYFDRTLAALAPRPFAIGVGLHAARLTTIHPQPHDIVLDAIVTEAGIELARDTR